MNAMAQSTPIGQKKTPATAPEPALKQGDTPAPKPIFTDYASI